MAIIHRYVLRQFVQVFLITFCSLMGLIVVIDAFGNLDEFSTYAEKYHVSLLRVIGGYYSYRTVDFFTRTGGLLTLIAAMFTVAWIRRNNELTALEAAGVSKRRVLMPVLWGAVVIAILGAASRELIVPRIRDHLIDNAQNLEGTTAKKLQQCYDNRTEILFRGDETYSDHKRIHMPSFLLPPALSEYGRQLVARDAFYEAPQADRPGGYRFVDVVEPRDLDRELSLKLDGQGVILTPRDTNWLKKGECFVVSDMSFDQLQEGSTWWQFSSLPELMRALRGGSVAFGANVRVAIHSRLVQPLLDITLLFLGLPLILGRENRNIFWAIGLCMGIVSVFMLVVLGCQQLGTSYLVNPALAAWLPLILFVPCAVGLADPLLE